MIVPSNGSCADARCRAYRVAGRRLAALRNEETMIVTDLMARGALCVREDEALSAAIALMARHDLGGLPVRGDAGRVVGVISKTDVLDRVAEGKTLDVAVGESMSAPALTVAETTPIDDALRAMADEGVHRLVVLDETGEPVGIFSPWDVVRAVTEGRLALSSRP